MVQTSYMIAERKKKTDREYKSSSLSLIRRKNVWWDLYQELSAFFQDTREKNEAFGSSLLLANSPMSPKVVNGSFAAIIDADEFLAKAYAGIRIVVSFSLSKLDDRVRQLWNYIFLLIIFQSLRITILRQCGDESAGS